MKYVSQSLALVVSVPPNGDGVSADSVRFGLEDAKNSLEVYDDMAGLSGSDFAVACLCDTPARWSSNDNKTGRWLLVAHAGGHGGSGGVVSLLYGGPSFSTI